jgi:glycosyltransferase involved in cell wall biosynthesis
MALLMELEARGIEFRLQLLGQQFRRQPPIFKALIDRFQARIVHAGYLPSRDDYEGTIRACDVVISTAMHEFQGLSILEAAAAGVWPLVPDRLSYPEFFEGPHRYDSSPDDPQAEARAAADTLQQWLQAGRPRFDSASLQSLCWPAIGAQWRALLERLASIS